MEVHFAWAVWRLMEAILEFGTPSEPMRRMMVARLYYAAYHLALLLLRNAGWTPPTGRGAHRDVLIQLRQRYVNAGRMNANTVDALQRLMRLRVRADYRIDLRVHEGHVLQAMRLFRMFFDESRQILGVF